MSAEALQKVDVIIAGGGVVGLSAALAIANHTNFKVAVVEAFSVTSQNTSDLNVALGHPSFDARVVALAKQSYLQLQRFGVQVDRVDLCPIKHIHVSDRGHLGQVKLEEKDPMGYVVALQHLGAQLQNQVEKHSNISLYQPDKIRSITQEPGAIECRCESVALRGKLLLVAEGATSTTKSLLNISNHVVDYEQTAIIANVEAQRPHHNQAFERFTSQGPLALLPMNGGNANRLSMVWTLDSSKANDILSLTNTAFLDALRRLFSDKLGRFLACSDKVSYPLKLTTASDFIHHRAICLGNAAQSLHPIAGQGFNLGVRDIDALLDVLKDGQYALGSFHQLKRYRELRAPDKQSVVTATNALVKVFSNQYLPLIVGRNLGLLGLNQSTLFKQQFVKFAMGER
ncbi:FAD-dependent oxidoreductase [Glaciecola sp. KUL10]|uniref:FAD-dependent oxidoreductase n=1 Tax=Glaciecola sp. (strain KUL10) TaxID=2161813 RepID=UPI000D783B0B|nr:FAD-dependent oxidoreductase [Glaciecola sp. KUL10]GBL05656.1 2-octaprenyl-6-methoxyphenyl hydroxylase [Glaciecola sp. KUL10]